jgi:hypothetical protein
MSMASSVTEEHTIAQNLHEKGTIIVRSILSHEVGEFIEFGVPIGGRILMEK